MPRLCGVALNAYLTMLLDTGTLHCDPCERLSGVEPVPLEPYSPWRELPRRFSRRHPGNLLRTPEGKLCILDWGMTLDVPKDLQLSLLEFIADLTAENYERVPDDLVLLFHEL